MFSGAVQNPDIKSLRPNILLWSKWANLSISMSYLLRVCGAEKKRGICKTWMSIFFVVVMQFLRMWWWILLIWQFSFGVIEREKGKDYIILLRIVSWDKYLHLPCSACLFCCDSLYSAGLPQSHHSGSSLSFVWACWICFALWGARWGWGVRAITCLSSIPPLSFLSFPSASVVLFFLYCSILFLSPQVLSAHILFKYVFLRLLRVSSNPHVVHQPEANGAVLSPVGSLRLDQGWTLSDTFWSKKTWCPLLKSPVNSSSNLHIATPPISC